LHIAILKPVDFQITDEELEKVLTEIDRELRESSPQVSGRELRGWSAFCKKFRLDMASYDPLAVRIHEWFKQQYGERLNMNLDFGDTVAEIRNDFYSIRLAPFWGAMIVHCDPLLHGSDFGPNKKINAGPIKSNLFNSVKGLTAIFIKSLTADECNNLLDAYARGFLGFSRMKDARGAPYSKEALDDLTQSASQLTSRSPNFGFSRWASLQAAEKILKSFIEVQGKTFRKNHDLNELATTASACGLPSLPPNLLTEIQCSANVRYSSSSVAKKEALRAHYAVLTLSAEVAPLLKPQSGWISRVRTGSYVIGDKPRPIKCIKVTRGKPV